MEFLSHSPPLCLILVGLSPSPSYVEGGTLVPSQLRCTGVVDGEEGEVHPPSSSIVPSFQTHPVMSLACGGGFDPQVLFP